MQKDKKLLLVQLNEINFGYFKNFIFDNKYSNGQYKKTVSNKNLLKLVPEFRFTDLGYGIRETVSWFVNNYETCRK